jgi:5-oxoprolinase (ATP-hydrolysing)
MLGALESSILSMKCHYPSSRIGFSRCRLKASPFVFVLRLFSGHIANRLPQTVDFTEEELKDTNALLKNLRSKFTEMHDKQFGFSLATAELETMRLRVKTVDASEEVDIRTIEETTNSTPPESAIMMKQLIGYEGKKVEAIFWDRSKITKSGYKIPGPAIITEMDSNTLILPGYIGEIDSFGNILIWPDSERESKEKIIHTAESAQQLVKDSPLISTLISSALGSIRREMDTLMLRCAMSPAIREQQDEFNVITNTRGQMLVGQFGSFITQFLQIWKGTIEEGMYQFGTVIGYPNLFEGDVFVTNDVYQIDGAVSHLNDVIVLLPIFYNHDLIGWVSINKLDKSQG